MTKCGHAFSIAVALVLSVAGHTQTAPVKLPGAGDYSQEAAVVQEMSTKLAFENDGNSTYEQTSRVRVQTDAGVKQWGLLSFPFQSATQIVEIDYVRVRKADGNTITTPPDNAQDLDAEITRSAPFYSDLREKHIAVKGLGNGDTLEFAAHWRTTKPLIPGQFWFEYNFQRGIVLSEKLEIKVPAERAIKVKGSLAKQTVRTEAGSRVYTWTFSKLENDKEPENVQKKAIEAARGRLPQPDVQISSFQSWDEVGRWYWNLQKDRVEPTPAIRAKAAELTKGLTDDDAKLHALYAFVSMQYRYIGIAFGIGRYQPHAAEDVLTNSYGDCKDKHTLLASLLQASGFTLYPALISSTRNIEPEVPSPAQFDHIVGYLPRGKDARGKDAPGKDAVWLDTTPEVAPLGYLIPQLRDKQALVMSGEQSIQLVTTPVDPPVPSTSNFKIEGKLGDDGTFEAKVEDTTQGEGEVLVRAAFRQVPQSKWKDLVQQISFGLGFAGTVSDVSASAPEASSEPFHFAYSYHRKDYPDWTNHQLTVPGLPFYMPEAKDDAKDPIWLGTPVEAESDSRVELPQGYSPQVPPNVDLKYDFAEYHASYSEDRAVLIAKRRMLIKMHEIPVAELDDYRNFIKSLQNDLNRYVTTLSANSVFTPSAQPAASFPSYMNGVQDLPDSDSAEANHLEAAARDDLTRRDVQGAVTSLYRSVSADPKFARAWVFLGTILISQKQMDAGMDAFHKAMAAAPAQAAIPKVLAFGLMADSKFEDAIPIWQDYIKAHPADADGQGNLGNCLVNLKRYSEAATAFEAALKINEKRADMQAQLASAYLLGGDREKAGSAFGKLAAVDPQGFTLNDAAYEMANADLNLPLALEYAKKAVHAAEEESQKITLTDLKLADLRGVELLSAYWDTLGWVHDHMSNPVEAEPYLQAAWKLTQDGVVADHLCQVYQQTHRTGLAIQMCRSAVARLSMSHQLALSQYKTEADEAQKRLDHLTAGPAKSNGMPEAFDLAIRDRTFKLPRFLPGTESAEFFVLLAADGKSKSFKVEDVKFVSGSDKMKLEGKQLRSIDFHLPAPSDIPTHLVRRGILGCYQYTGCSFVLLEPSSVHSLN
jgi:tetratricopeptide (TPR) repeat protein/transglutaminase-like putative cysteine protease